MLEWWQYVLIPILGGLVGILPVGFYRDALTRRADARRRRLMDVAADFRRIARDLGVEDSGIHTAYEETEARYQALLQEYEKVDQFKK